MQTANRITVRMIVVWPKPKMIMATGTRADSGVLLNMLTPRRPVR